MFMGSIYIHVCGVFDAFVICEIRIEYIHVYLFM